MADITVLKIDARTRDLCFDDDGIMETLEDGEAIAQNIRNNLLAWKGEFDLVPAHGTEWERVAGLHPNRAVDEADDVLRRSIFQEPYVQEIEKLDVQTEGRTLAADFSGKLYDGSTVRVEVNTDV